MIFSINHVVQQRLFSNCSRSPFGLQDAKIGPSRQKETHKRILFAPINSPLEAMRHHAKHWSLLLLLCAVASGVFAFTKNFFHLVAFRCPFDLVLSGDFAYTVSVSLCAMTKWCCPQQLPLQP